MIIEWIRFGKPSLVGIVTGMVGAGGGFLIIPALVLLAKLPMKKAVATSLFIIAINSLIGFLGDVQNYDIDWLFLLLFTSISVVGIFIGIWLNKFALDSNTHSSRFFRMRNEIPTVLLILIVILVISKPF